MDEVYIPVRMFPLFHICKLKNDVTMKKFFIILVGFFTSFVIAESPANDLFEPFLEEQLCSSFCTGDEPCDFCKSLSSTEDVMYDLIKDGMRHIDASKFPNIEEAVGRAVERAISEGICKREDLFITIKMAAWCKTPEMHLSYFLQKLHVSYIDLCILLESDEKERNDEVFFCLIDDSAKGVVRSVVVSNASAISTVTTFINDFSLMPEFSSR